LGASSAPPIQRTCPNPPRCRSKSARGVAELHALRYFAGASPYNIMTKYRISKKSVSESVWAVVEAVNNLDEFIIEYPDSEEVQLEIARNF
jgi:hypothetical protein